MFPSFFLVATTLGIAAVGTHLKERVTGQERGLDELGAPQMQHGRTDRSGDGHPVRQYQGCMSSKCALNISIYMW